MANTFAVQSLTMLLREVTPSCPTLCDPMDCSLPGSSIHGILRQEHWKGSTTGANCSSGFMLIFFFFFTMLFVFSCKSWNVAKPGARLVRPPPGAQQFQDLPPILSMVPWACAHSRHVVRAVSREVGNKVRGLPCFLFSEARTRLLPFNFPNTW